MALSTLLPMVHLSFLLEETAKIWTLYYDILLPEDNSSFALILLQKWETTAAALSPKKTGIPSKSSPYVPLPVLIANLINFRKLTFCQSSLKILPMPWSTSKNTRVISNSVPLASMLRSSLKLAKALTLTFTSSRLTTKRISWKWLLKSFPNKNSNPLLWEKAQQWRIFFSQKTHVPSSSKATWAGKTKIIFSTFAPLLTAATWFHLPMAVLERKRRSKSQMKITYVSYWQESFWD